jgi:hypothetical protein
MSLLKILNKRGPRVEPCGTPNNTEKREETFESYERMKICLISSFGTT